MRKKLESDNYKVLLENPKKMKKDDIIGFDSEIERLKYSIKEGANIIGIISDFGAWKSTIIELLRKLIIVIKDLDRIKNPVLVKYYINEFYIIYIEGNHKHKKGVTSWFCVKDEFAYEELKDNQ